MAAFVSQKDCIFNLFYVLCEYAIRFDRLLQLLTPIKQLRMVKLNFYRGELMYRSLKVFRHPKTNARILNEPVCVDDFGSLVFLCQYTKKYFSVSEKHEYHGPVMPNVTGTFICKEGALIAFKESKYCFDVDMDKNCNTCAKLKRMPFENRGKWTFQPGTCDSFDGTHQYFRGDHFLFHPDDPMYHYTEKCYTPRPFKFQASQTLLHP